MQRAASSLTLPPDLARQKPKLTDKVAKTKRQRARAPQTKALSGILMVITPLKLLVAWK